MKVAIIGTGYVGAALAAELINWKPIVKKLLLFDVDSSRLDGEYLDLINAAEIKAGPEVVKGNYSALDNEDLVVITAGRPRKLDETRADLAGVNYRIVKSIISEIINHGVRPYILLITNPIEIIITRLNYDNDIHYPREKLIGSGTYLDSIRLCHLIRERLNLKWEDKVEALIIGEHGREAIPVFSQARVNSRPLTELISATVYLDELEKQTKDYSSRIISGKGQTNWGISAVTAKVVELISGSGQGRSIPLSVYIEEPWQEIENVAISLPVEFVNYGFSPIKDYKISEKERIKLLNTVNYLQNSAK